MAEKVINADQKTSLLKKPALQAQLLQLQEQLAHIQKVEQDLRARAKAERDELERSLAQKHEAEKAQAVEEAVEAARAAHKQDVDSAFLVVSRFLRLAAARRTEEANPDSDENQALEGVLLLLYTGDEVSVETTRKLVAGAADKTTSTAGDELPVTCKCSECSKLNQIIMCC